MDSCPCSESLRCSKSFGSLCSALPGNCLLHKTLPPSPWITKLVHCYLEIIWNTQKKRDHEYLCSQIKIAHERIWNCLPWDILETNLESSLNELNEFHFQISTFPRIIITKCSCFIYWNNSKNIFATTKTSFWWEIAFIAQKKSSQRGIKISQRILCAMKKRDQFSFPARKIWAQKGPWAGTDSGPPWASLGHHPTNVLPLHQLRDPILVRKTRIYPQEPWSQFEFPGINQCLQLGRKRPQSHGDLSYLLFTILIFGGNILQQDPSLKNFFPMANPQLNPFQLGIFQLCR